MPPSPLRVDDFYERQSNATVHGRAESLRSSRFLVESLSSAELTICPSGWLRRQANDSVDLERSCDPSRLALARALLVSYDHGTESGL
jgi:hypothetical protein